MSRVRILLTLLIAFTLPWQGVAAATRVHCIAMAGGGTAIQAPQHAGGSHGDGAHAYAVDAVATDSHHHAQAAHSSAPTGHDKADCSAFCCAATISASTAPLLAGTAGLPLLPDVPAVRPSYQPDAFDRPPRT